MNFFYYATIVRSIHIVHHEQLQLTFFSFLFLILCVLLSVTVWSFPLAFPVYETLTKNLKYDLPDYGLYVLDAERKGGAWWLIFSVFGLLFSCPIFSPGRGVSSHSRCKVRDGFIGCFVFSSCTYFFSFLLHALIC
jgi:hypothetical protein